MEPGADVVRRVIGLALLVWVGRWAAREAASWLVRRRGSGVEPSGLPAVDTGELDANRD